MCDWLARYAKLLVLVLFLFVCGILREGVWTFL